MPSRAHLARLPLSLVVAASAGDDATLHAQLVAGGCYRGLLAGGVGDLQAAARGGAGCRRVRRLGRKSTCMGGALTPCTQQRPIEPPQPLLAGSCGAKLGSAVSIPHPCHAAHPKPRHVPGTNRLDITSCTIMHQQRRVEQPSQAHLGRQQGGEGGDAVLGHGQALGHGAHCRRRRAAGSRAAEMRR